MTLTPHPYAELLIAIAEGKQMQMRMQSESENLVGITSDEALYWVRKTPSLVSIKPEPTPTMVINGHVVPAPMRVAPMRVAPMRVAPMRVAPMRVAPMRVAPNQGTTYFLPSLYSPDEPNVLMWHDDRWDLRWLAAGLCQATEQGAIDCAKALLSLLAPQEVKS